MSDSTSFPLPGANQGQNLPADFDAAAAAASEKSHTPENSPESEPRATNDAAPSAEQSACAKASPRESGVDRRRKRRALISAPVRVRGLHCTDGGPDEISTTIDVSRIGVLFLTQFADYKRGMEVVVTFPYSNAPTAIHAEQPGRVARIVELPDGRRAVAIALGAGITEDLMVDAGGREIVDADGRDLVDAGGRQLAVESAPAAAGPALGTVRPLVLAVDADDMVRNSLKIFLTNEGYDVIALNNCPDAYEVLKMYTPALVIAEVEGEGLPGFALCAHVKETPGLRRIPVVLTTSSGYPSDYSNAHSLGAVVCMAKPYKQERLGHVVRLLAPQPQWKLEPAPAPRASACTNGGANAAKCRNGGDSASTKRWRFRFS
ncbi:MAG: response regulator [Candidatus Acidiferrales bacterium]